jgi:hypothetical protein
LSEPAQDARLIPWESFRTAFVESGVPANVPVEGDPPLILFTEADGSRLGLRAEISGAGLMDLQVPEAVRLDVGPEHVSISAEDPEMFAPFYAFLLDVANRLQLSRVSAREALWGAVTAWRRMLAAPRLMTHEERLGLLGELWVLERLLEANGSGSFAAWTGAQREVHDFRLDGVEVEVKTTMGSSRTHLIGGPHQLTPSEGMELYLLSIHLERAGLAEGWSLSEQIGRVRDLLEGDSAAAAGFSAQLEDLGWVDTDAAYYPDRFRLRSEPTVISVDSAFPRLTDAELRPLLGERLDRVREIRYRVDVEGLGVSYPSDEFLAVVPLEA